MVCPFCGSQNIEEGLLGHDLTSTEYVGLAYKKGPFILTCPIYHDLCLDCKTIVRSYIKDETNLNWVKNK